MYIWSYAIEKLVILPPSIEGQLVQWILRRHPGMEVYVKGWVKLYLKHKKYAID